MHSEKQHMSRTLWWLGGGALFGYLTLLWFGMQSLLLHIVHTEQRWALQLEQERSQWEQFEARMQQQDPEFLKRPHEVRWWHYERWLEKQGHDATR